MKVGILSMQKVMNYGSFLQSFALKKTIEEFGHQCEFIDIEQGRIFPELKRTIAILNKEGIRTLLQVGCVEAYSLYLYFSTTLFA